LTEFSVENSKASCEFTDVERGTYTVNVTASLNGSDAETIVSDPVQVKDVEPVNPATLETNLDTYEQIGLTWTVNSPTEGQKYNVYLDDVLKAENLDASTYTLQNVASGSHTVKVTATYGVYETEGQSRTVVVTSAPVTKYDTIVTQVTTGAKQTLADSVWSYEFASQSADSYIGVSDDGAVIAYFPTYAGGAVDHVYETLTNLVVGKTYTYTYTVYSDVSDGNNIPVKSTGGYEEDYTLEGVSSAGATVVTKKFTATATEMNLDYTLGFVNNKAAIKITPATVTLVQPVDITSVTAQGGINTINVSWECNDAVEEQKYSIYLNDSTTPIASDVDDTSYSIVGVEAGDYTVTVKATLNGIETTGLTSSTVSVSEAEKPLVSSAITVEGFQIKTNDIENDVAFRTVCKAPNKGSQIEVDGETYTVADMGTIYVKDTNYSGYRRADILNASYTVLNPEKVTGTSYDYVGVNGYDGVNYTYGYLATDEGVLDGWDANDTENTYYVRTMNKATSIMAYSIHVRAFVVTTDGTIIYGEDTAVMSIAQVADYLYTNGKAQNFTGHKYLYNEILNKVESTNPYYRTSTIDYGWDQNLYIPDNTSAILNAGSLDELNGIS
jgi:hypothetical protein